MKMLLFCKLKLMSCYSHFTHNKVTTRNILDTISTYNIEFWRFKTPSSNHYILLVNKAWQLSEENLVKSREVGLP